MSAKKADITQHQLYTAKPRVWRALKRANAIPDKFKSKAKEIGRYNRVVAILARLQKWMFQAKINKLDLSEKPPLFILGHWRSGTTHLQYLVAEDPRLGYLSNYQCLFFNIALVSRTWLRPIISLLFPKVRPMDNVQMGVDKPGEEEQPLGATSTLSGLHSIFFPKNQSYNQKYTLFQGISDAEKKQWKKDFLNVVKNIAYYNDNKPLVLKNPHNTSRIKVLLELFPKAKFIFIHRKPYDVYRSTVHLYNTVIRSQMLQDFSEEEISETVIYMFRDMMKSYLAQRDLIPQNNLVEITYTDLDQNPMECMENIYTALDLPAYQAAKPKMEAYLASVNHYKKNKFSVLPEPILKRLHEEWGFYFEGFGYEKLDVE